MYPRYERADTLWQSDKTAGEERRARRWTDSKHEQQVRRSRWHSWPLMQAMAGGVDHPPACCVSDEEQLGEDGPGEQEEDGPGALADGQSDA